MRALSLAEARGAAVAAAGLADARPGRVDARHLRRLFGQVSSVQIDCVNVLARAHEIALYSRLGAYPADLLHRHVYERGEVFECWAHQASYAPVELQPLLRHRGAEYARRTIDRRLADAPPGFLASVEAEIAERGPLAASELSGAGSRNGPWWGWSPGKAACEALFATGRLAIADRRHFTRVYDLAERVLPARVLSTPTPGPEEAHRELLLRAARACGVGTAADLADYFRLPAAPARRLLADLVAEGSLEEAEIEGIDERAYLHPHAHLPPAPGAQALLSPFDSLVWHRPRTERLFGFVFRLEIYVPAAERTHGYYVLPFLLGDRLVARVDLKAAREQGRLLVRHAWGEPAADLDVAVPALAHELGRMAAWLGLGTIEVSHRPTVPPAPAPGQQDLLEPLAAVTAQGAGSGQPSLELG